MKKTKQKILKTALELFNSDGVANISIRQIAKKAGISHSNLIYHYKSKWEIVQGIHNLLLEKAIELNRNINRENYDISSLYSTTKRGFEVLYEFRFLFYDLLYICQQDPIMKQTLREVEKVRFLMYKEVIDLSIKNGLMKKEAFSGQYEHFITHIRIFSDFWISSAAIYDDSKKKINTDKYARLFMQLFYNYLTKLGKADFEKQKLI